MAATDIRRLPHLTAAGHRFRFARVTLAIACAVSTFGALANPCPPDPRFPAPPYATLTGTVVVAGSDTIGSGPINICLIDGGSLEIAGTLTSSGTLIISPGGGRITVDSGG